MAELPHRSNEDRESAAPKRPVTRVDLPGGESVIAWRERDRVALVIDVPNGGTMVTLPAPIAAYLAGGLAVLAGVHSQ